MTISSISIQMARRQLVALLAQDQSRPGVAETVLALQTLLGDVGGFIPSGVYDAGHAYLGGEVVSYSGGVWVAIDASTGVTPGSDADKWVQIMGKGDPGADLVSLGIWDSGTAYVVDEVASHSGALWQVLVNNTNSEPTDVNTDWQKIVAAGTPGAAGPPGLTNQGAWDVGTAYVINDLVSDGGSAYVCILGHTGHEPPNATYWTLLVAKGDAGAGAVAAHHASARFGTSQNVGVGGPATTQLLFDQILSDAENLVTYPGGKFTYTVPQAGRYRVDMQTFFSTATWGTADTYRQAVQQVPALGGGGIVGYCGGFFPIIGYSQYAMFGGFCEFDAIVGDVITAHMVSYNAGGIDAEIRGDVAIAYLMSHISVRRVA